MVAKNRVWECPSCKHQFDDYIKDVDRDVGVQCPICDGQCVREDELITVPNALRASWPDGRRTETAARLIEAAKLTSEMYDKPEKERGELRKTIKELKTPKGSKPKSK